MRSGTPPALPEPAEAPEVPEPPPVDPVVLTVFPDPDGAVPPVVVPEVCWFEGGLAMKSSC
jgi:hypothetical protein